ncbi:Asp-tRNA(Asn)/Glu-tRNA(Gln) amidotransferase A subunit family amidase [Glaciihabitans tibetensis]|uniref:Asp-tRNA(Asn)/Glu-tRNA(Gln) amidotransferase A subunit family amidase n=1 Tax=Glaciihabitans tibetensis TaxID=1266600 RepID=A0A2T0VG61_9MICO|nr:AtzH-like domain-containing protein [Glaciihabitans tibetensis]PRY69044.1 Asp-tRNA(Asn)/Glu-tRNA(Gln) amidotransferase A subunit family amidase [Glaciihabitans tibetensis]
MSDSYFHSVPVHLPSGSVAPDGLLDAFWEYERALMANDLPALDRLFAPGENTMRGDAAGLLVGHDTISSFRNGRGGAPSRVIAEVHLRPVTDDAVLVVAVTVPPKGGRGQQTQLWRKLESGWAVEVAHVATPAPAINSAVWRVVGAPLVAGTVHTAHEDHPASHGPLPLDGQTVAVKDLFSVAGFAVGAGVPAYLAGSAPATSTAPAVLALLVAGADVQGIAQTDEFAYSIAGKNPHYGTPPNPAVVGGISGGSSSGPASAVGLGQASIGLGTDTGGSIRVPASYQGLWGLRTTHGAVSTEGLLPLAESFDTVGWLTRDHTTLRAAAAASVSGRKQMTLDRRFAVAPSLLSLATPEVAAAFRDLLAELTEEGLLADLVDVELGDIDKLFETFRTVQAAEAWAQHGPWIEAHPGALGDDIAARFAWASTITAEAEALSRSALMVAEARIAATLDDRILLLPSASSVAPATTADAGAIEATRAGTLRLTCIAGIARMPALSVPLLQTAHGPAGLCLVGPRFGDLSLVDVGGEFARGRV